LQGEQNHGRKMGP
jgi:hypothetical protein